MSRVRPYGRDDREIDLDEQTYAEPVEIAIPSIPADIADQFAVAAIDPETARALIADGGLVYADADGLQIWDASHDLPGDVPLTPPRFDEDYDAIKRRYERERRIREREERARAYRARVADELFRRAQLQAVHAIGKSVAASARDIFGLDALLGEERTS